MKMKKWVFGFMVVVFALASRVQAQEEIVPVDSQPIEMAPAMTLEQMAVAQKSDAALLIQMRAVAVPAPAMVADPPTQIPKSPPPSPKGVEPIVSDDQTPGPLNPPTPPLAPQPPTGPPTGPTVVETILSADGGFTMYIDTDGDGIADIVMTVDPNGEVSGGPMGDAPPIDPPPSIHPPPSIGPPPPPNLDIITSTESESDGTATGSVTS